MLDTIGQRRKCSLKNSSETDHRREWAEFEVDKTIADYSMTIAVSKHAVDANEFESIT